MAELNESDIRAAFELAASSGKISFVNKVISSHQFPLFIALLQENYHAISRYDLRKGGFTADNFSEIFRIITLRSNIEEFHAQIGNLSVDHDVALCEIAQKMNDPNNISVGNPETDEKLRAIIRDQATASGSGKPRSRGSPSKAVMDTSAFSQRNSVTGYVRKIPSPLNSTYILEDGLKALTPQGAKNFVRIPPRVAKTLGFSSPVLLYLLGCHNAYLRQFSRDILVRTVKNNAHLHARNRAVEEYGEDASTEAQRLDFELLNFIPHFMIVSLYAFPMAVKTDESDFSVSDFPAWHHDMELGMGILAVGFGPGASCFKTIGVKYDNGALAFYSDRDTEEFAVKNPQALFDRLVQLTALRSDAEFGGKSEITEGECLAIVISIAHYFAFCVLSYAKDDASFQALLLDGKTNPQAIMQYGCKFFYAACAAIADTDALFPEGGLRPEEYKCSRVFT